MLLGFPCVDLFFHLAWFLKFFSWRGHSAPLLICFMRLESLPGLETETMVLWTEDFPLLNCFRASIVLLVSMVDGILAGQWFALSCQQNWKETCQDWSTEAVYFCWLNFEYTVKLAIFHTPFLPNILAMWRKTCLLLHYTVVSLWLSFCRLVPVSGGNDALRQATQSTWWCYFWISRLVSSPLPGIMAYSYLYCTTICILLFVPRNILRVCLLQVVSLRFIAVLISKYLLFETVGSLLDAVCWVPRFQGEGQSEREQGKAGAKSSSRRPSSRKVRVVSDMGISHGFIPCSHPILSPWNVVCCRERYLFKIPMASYAWWWWWCGLSS